MMQQLVGGADPASPLEVDWETASGTSAEQAEEERNSGRLKPACSCTPQLSHQDFAIHRGEATTGERGGVSWQCFVAHIPWYTFVSWLSLFTELNQQASNVVSFCSLCTMAGANDTGVCDTQAQTVGLKSACT